MERTGFYLEHHRVGSARSGAARDAAWTRAVASTRSLAGLATDPMLERDLTVLADGMTRIAAEPGNLDRGLASLEKNNPSYFAVAQAASDRLEAACGPITGDI